MTPETKALLDKLNITKVDGGQFMFDRPMLSNGTILEAFYHSAHVINSAYGKAGTFLRFHPFDEWQPCFVLELV